MNWSVIYGTKKYIDLIDEYGFDLIKGEARFINESTIEVKRTSIFCPPAF